MSMRCCRSALPIRTTAWFREFVLQWILCREDYLGRVRPPEAVRSLLALDEQWPVSIYMDEQVKIPAAVSALTGELQILLDALKASLESKSSDVQKGASL